MGRNMWKVPHVPPLHTGFKRTLKNAKQVQGGTGKSDCTIRHISEHGINVGPLALPSMQVGRTIDLHLGTCRTCGLVGSRGTGFPRPKGPYSC